MTLAVNVSDTVATSTSMMLHSPPTESRSTEGVRIEREDPNRRSVAVDVTTKGVLIDHIAGQSPEQSATELQTASLLVERLNLLGGSW